MNNNLVKIWLTITLAISLYLILTYAESLFIPIIIAVIFTPAFTPLINFAKKYKIPEWLTISLSITLSIVIIALVFYILAISIKNSYDSLQIFIDNLKKFHDKVFNYIHSRGIMKQGSLDFLETSLLDFISNASESLLGIATKTITITTNFFSYFFLTTLYLFFLLTYRRRITKALFEMEITKQIFLSYENFNYVINKLRRYVYSVLIVMVVMWLLLGSVLWLLRVPHPYLWSGIAAIANLIPYLGMTATALSCAFFTSIVNENGYIFIPVMIVFWGINLLENNVITPYLAGKNLELNALSILIFAFVGFYFWGIIGSILAIPILIFTKLVAEINPEYKVWNILISE